MRIALRKTRRILYALCITVIASAPFLSHAQDVIRIGGTGSALGTMKVLAGAFEKSYPTAKVSVMPSLGSSGAIKAVAQGAIEIGISGRALKEEEMNRGLSAAEYARTPFVPVVHAGVALSAITAGEIVRIYTGEMKMWPNGERIRLVLRPASDVDTSLLKDISPEMGRAVDAALSRTGMLTGINDQQNAELLEHTPGAFGFSTLAQVSTENPELKMLTWNGVRPSVQALAKGSYPFSKRLFFVTKGPLSPATRTFIDFVLSSEGRKLLEQTGNMPLAGAQRK